MLKKYFKNINKKSCIICFIISLLLAWALQWLAINFSGGDDFAKFWTAEFKRIDSGNLQTIIIAILTMFIPVAISFLNVKSKIIKWALMAKVLYVKELTICSVIILVVLAIFPVTPIIIMLLTYYLGWIFIKPMSSLWKWFDKMDMTYLFEFFKGLTVKKEDRQKIIDSYSSLWTDKDLITENNEKEFTEIFIKHVDKAFENNDYELAVELCDGYLKNIENRSKLSIFLLFKNVFKWINIETTEDKHDGIDNYSSIYITYGPNFFRVNFTEGVFRILIEDGFDHGSFRIMNQYSSKIKEFEGVYERLFEILFNSSVRYIPKNWEITKQSWKDWKDRKNIIVPVIFDTYIEFVQKRISIKREEGLDEKLERISSALFPDVNIKEFAIAVMFIIHRSKSPRSFGYFSGSGLINNWSGDKKDLENAIMEARDNKMRDTFELLELLWATRLREERLKQSQKDLRKTLKEEENDNNRDVDTINRIKETLEFIGKYLEFLENKK